jgi:hypothetical protein
MSVLVTSAAVTSAAASPAADRRPAEAARSIRAAEARRRPAGRRRPVDRPPQRRRVHQRQRRRQRPPSRDRPSSSRRANQDRRRATPDRRPQPPTVRTSLGVAFFRASAPDSGAAEAQSMDIATLAASIAAAARRGTYFFIWCSPVAAPPKRNDRSTRASLEFDLTEPNVLQHCGEISGPRNRPSLARNGQGRPVLSLGSTESCVSCPVACPSVRATSPCTWS